MTPSAGTNPAPLRRSDLIILGICALLVGLFYSNATHPDPAPGQPVLYSGHRYYAWQAEAWLQGRLDIGLAVPPRLLALPDPYDPKANEAMRFGGGETGFHDLSLYQGKFYMYWGPTPALVAFLPWRLITGQPLASATAATTFALITWLASALLLMRIARRHFPHVGPAILTIATLGLAVCNWAAVPLARPGVWEVPIFGACCFGALTWWLLVECYWARASAKPIWLALASTSWGLAIGSRPIWIVGAVILLWPLWNERTRWRERSFQRLALCAIVPVTLCVLAILWHNYARFGSILQFGQGYQLAGVRMHATSAFSAGSVLFNLRNYFFALPRIGDYFPFVLSPQITRVPPGYLGIEFTLGLLVILPFLWCGLLALFRREARELMVPVLLSFFCVLGILSLFAGASPRYELEIAAPLALLASVGLVACWPARRWTRSLYAIGAVLLVGCSTATAMMASGRMLIINWQEPTPHAWFGHMSNRVASTLGWAFSDGTYGVEMTVVFPPGRKPDAEALVASGAAPFFDAVMVDYPDPDHVRFHYFHDKLLMSSPPQRLPRENRHQIRIEMTAMLPPPNHPFWGDLPANEIEQRRSYLKVTCNGETVLHAQASNHSPSHSEPNIGGVETEVGPTLRFSGQILEARLLRVTSYK